MGTAAAVWFDRGERLSGEAMGRIGRTVTQGIVGRLLPLGKRKPKRLTLREQVDQALKDIPSADHPPAVEGGGTPPIAALEAHGGKETLLSE